MPAWKKVIVSGSDAKLNSLLVTQSVTASVGDFTTELTASGLHYPTADGGADYVLTTDGNGKLTFEYIRTIYETVKNVGTQSLAKGTPVYTVDTTGNTFNVDLADAIDTGKMPASFILAQALAPDEEGLGIILGFINGVNTSQFGEGDVVFVAPGGGYTNVQPTGSALIQPLGQVLKVDASNGSGVVFNPGVTTGLPNIEPGKLWVGNSDGVPTAIFTSSLYSGSYSGSFKGNGSQLTGVTVPFTSITSKPTLVSGSSQITYSQIAGVPTTLISSSTGTDNYIPRYLNGKALENSLIYDNGTNVGIGTTSPQVVLHLHTTDGIRLPTGSYGQRPLTPIAGTLRFNNSVDAGAGALEYYTGATWATVVGNRTEVLVTLEYLVLSGGGGGGSANTSPSSHGGGGGGGGAYSSGSLSFYRSPYRDQVFTVTVGAGGAQNSAGQTSTLVDYDSVTIISRGGGGRGGNNTNANGGNGASGGGGRGGSSPGTGGSRLIAGLGNNGGDGNINYRGGGGGGFTSAGTAGSSRPDGGAGIKLSSIAWPSLPAAGVCGGGGGGAGVSGDTNYMTGGSASFGGGIGVGADTGTGVAYPGATGTANSGGGGGGSGKTYTTGYAGGSGVAVIKYAGSSAIATGGTVTTSGGYVYHTFTGTGTLTFTRLS